MELGERRKGKENDRTSAVSHNIICEGTGYTDMN
jgi:hypothetical protein